MSRKKSKASKFLKIFFSIVAFFILVAMAAGIGVTVAVIKSSPQIDANIMDNLKQSSKLYDKNGNFIEAFSDDQNRSIVELKDIPTYVQNAFISIEDERFRQHHGVDIKRVFGAIWIDIRTFSKAQGGSTLTMQLVRNTVLNQKKEFTRKLQEIYLSIQLERKLSKDQILEGYLNTIFLGGNSYGVQAASLSYFGKDVKDLDISEAALIAGMTRNPNRYYPFSEKNKTANYEALYTRRNIVLKKMLELGYITQNEYDTAYNEKFVFKTKASKSSMSYQWFIEPAIDQVAKDYAEKYNIDVSEAKQKLRIGGYSIYLTIDPKVQKAAEDVLNTDSYYKGLGLKQSLRYYTSDKRKPANGATIQKYPQPQAAAVIFDYSKGEVRAIVGGRGPHPLRSINRATSVPRQPGSSIKPLAVYSPAIDTKLATAGTVIEDSPMSKDFVASHQGWDPRNFETNKFEGRVTIREAIKKSINLVAIKLEVMLGTNTSIDYLQNKYHLSTIVTQGAYNDNAISPLALGALTEGVYPYEMAAAYGVFGNGGYYQSPIMYTKVVDNKGDTILDKTSNKTVSISPQAAYIMVDMLKGVVNGGTGTRAKFGSMPAAGKTGTAADQTNVWFCGLTPYLSGAIWIGHDKPNTPMPGLKSSLPAMLWGKIMKTAHQDLAVKDFTKPSGITTAEICIDSGKAPTDACRNSSRGNRVRTEMFIDGTQPTQLCDYHNKGGNGTTVDPDAVIDVPGMSDSSPDTPTQNSSPNNKSNNNNTNNNPDNGDIPPVN